ncbi:polymorphic toxin type 44 domain-containing protein [Cedecea colo]|nr:polymorphic toxin type 44 domain-containing protein [Cedecea colo]
MRVRKRNHGPWDYKNQRGRKYAAFGNFNYGGAAAGIPDRILLRGAGAAQILVGTSRPEFADYPGPNSYGDDPEDQIWIRAGIDYAKRSDF